MPEVLASLILAVLGTYAGIGIVFALLFAFRAVEKVDAIAAHAPIGFRLIIVPGAAALWPWLLARWAFGVRRRKP
jgi:hypothetical protein